MRLSDRARHHDLVTVELIPDRVVPGDLALLRGRVDAITVPALRNGHDDPSYPKSFAVTQQRRSLASAAIINRAGITAVPSLTCLERYHGSMLVQISLLQMSPSTQRAYLSIETLYLKLG